MFLERLDLRFYLYTYVVVLASCYSNWNYSSRMSFLNTHHLGPTEDYPQKAWEKPLRLKRRRNPTKNPTFMKQAQTLSLKLDSLRNMSLLQQFHLLLILTMTHTTSTLATRNRKDILHGAMIHHLQDITHTRYHETWNYNNGPWDA